MSVVQNKITASEAARALKALDKFDVPCEFCGAIRTGSKQIKTCSDACRSAKYRKNKKERDKNV